MIGGFHQFIFKKMLTGLPRRIKTTSGCVSGVIRPVLIVEGETCLVFEFMGVIRSTIIVRVIRTFHILNNFPSYFKCQISLDDYTMLI